MGLMFTDRELRAMERLWEHGSLTVHETLDLIEGDPPYTSVLSIYQTLEEKGHVDPVREGRAYRYHPITSREAAQRDAVEHLYRRIYRGRVDELGRHLAALTDGERP